MTVESTIGKITANGNGSATVFSFDPVSLFDSGDLTVTFVSTAGVETLLSEGLGTTNYSVTLSTPTSLPSTGSITYPVTLGTKLQNGESLVIKRVVDLTQQTDLGNQGGYFPEVQEAEFDRLAMADIQQQDLIDRSIKLNTHTTGVSVELPDPVAGQGLVWNGGANALISAALTLSADISNALIVVSAVQPSLVNGRIWIDTSAGGAHTIRLCDGTDYNAIITLFDISGNLNFSTSLSVAGGNLQIANSDPSTESITLVSSDTGALGPFEGVHHQSASPAISDVIWKKTFYGNNSVPVEKSYAEDRVIISDPTSTTEDGIRKFRTTVAGTLADRLNIGAGIFTPAQSDKGTNTINATNFYTGGTLMAADDASIQAGPTHAPSLLDHGKTFVYTGVCTVTMPTLASVFPGWHIRVYNLSSATITITRSAADFIRSKSTDLTSMLMPSTGDGGMLIADSGAGNQFLFIGKRSAKIADIAVVFSSTSTNAHNLGVIPDTVETVLVNTIAQGNWAPGDILDVKTFATAGAASGWAVQMDATNVTVFHGAAGVAFPNKTTWATTIAVAADWNIRFTNVSVIN